MDPTLGSIVSAAGAGIRAFKWWRHRRERAARLNGRRQTILSAALTAVAVLCSVLVMYLLANGN